MINEWAQTNDLTDGDLVLQFTLLRQQSAFTLQLFVVAVEQFLVMMQ